MDVWDLCVPDEEQMECIAHFEATFNVPTMSPTEEILPSRCLPTSQESTFIVALQESERKCR